MLIRLLLTSLFAVAVPSPTQAVDCASLSTRSTIAVKQLCAHPDLIERDAEVQRLTAELQGIVTGIDAEGLFDTQKPFERTLNGCSNQDSTKSGFYDAVAACVGTILADRLEVLRIAKNSPTTLRQAIRRYPTSLDLALFGKYGDQFVGARVSIFGCAVLGPGEHTSDRIHGRIDGSSASERTEKPVPVLFKSMTEQEAYFLDTRTPCSYWDGTVRRRGSELILFVEGILGNPLP